MGLAAGDRLGPYEIVAPLGAGGMGEVYRAKDTRLGRDVAVKVLPQHLSPNSEVRARFEREAKTVSSLNHPHICTLHDVGREGDTDYLVMELIEGETLAQRLAKGPLPLAEVLRLGAQIADALDRAHRAGVVHRDLKPGNVMLTRSGAKLLDFGLARATGLGPASGLTQLADGRGPAHRRRDDRRDLPVHGARAARRARSRRAGGPVGAGLRPLRDGDGEARLRGEEPGVADRGHHGERAGAGLAAVAHGAARARPPDRRRAWRRIPRTASRARTT